jgi:hypothetical protein
VGLGPLAVSPGSADSGATTLRLLDTAAMSLAHEDPRHLAADARARWRVLANLLEVALELRQLRGTDGLETILDHALRDHLARLGFNGILADVVESLGPRLVGAVLETYAAAEEAKHLEDSVRLPGTTGPSWAARRETAPEEEETSRRLYPDPPAEAAFYGVLGDVVRRLDPHTEADRVAVLAQVITYLGNLIGRGPHLLAEARRHHTNIFVCLVGATSKGRKGSSQGQVERVFRQVDERWARDRVTAGLSSGEGLIWSVRDAIERHEPVRKNGRVLHYETVVADPGVDDKRVLFAEEELSGVFGIMGRQGNSLSPTIRKAWDTGNL